MGSSLSVCLNIRVSDCGAWWCGVGALPQPVLCPPFPLTQQQYFWGLTCCCCGAGPHLFTPHFPRLHSLPSPPRWGFAGQWTSCACPQGWGSAVSHLRVVQAAASVQDWGRRVSQNHCCTGPDPAPELWAGSRFLLQPEALHTTPGLEAGWGHWAVAEHLCLSHLGQM